MSTHPNNLPAKSGRAGSDPLTLERHSLDVERAVEKVFGDESRWATSWRRFFRLGPADHARLLLNLRVAGLFHDLGKGNEDFVRSVLGQQRDRQTLRHEHLSALVLQLAPIRAWLSLNPILDLDAITASVLSHHLKASDDGYWRWAEPHGKLELEHYLAHPEIRRVLERVAEIASLPSPPCLSLPTWGPTASPWREALETGVQRGNAFRRALRATSGSARRSFMLAVKAGVIVADSVASGLVRENLALDGWIDERTRASDLTAQAIESDVLAPRRAEIERLSARPFTYHQFQTGAAGLGPRALLLAGCGAGKTLAAWTWARAQADHRAIGRVIFLYPTRGTATEGFRDYLGLAPEASAALLHGTARYELEAMRENPDEGRSAQDESRARLFALAYWSQRYFSATVDQFLGFMEHAYASLCLLPVLSDAAVVIDEVHSFDRHMFEVLLSFLGAFDVPVLCMTATLTRTRREQLAAAGLEVYPRPTDRDLLADLEHAETRARYRIHLVESGDPLVPEVARRVADGAKCLWVVNTVARCQELGRRLDATCDHQVLCYHSRFKLEDRHRAHQAVVASFKARGAPAVAVTTQVCEMSLDLDADVLVTEIAPLSALVQRMGRANRHPRRDAPDFVADVFVYPPESSAPYSKALLEPARAALEALRGRVVSQRELAESIERWGIAEAAPSGYSTFLSGGYYATIGELRDIDEIGQRVVLDHDVEAVTRLLRSGKSVDGFILTVPRVHAIEARPSARWPRWLGVAPGDRYDTRWGFDASRGEI